MFDTHVNLHAEAYQDDLSEVMGRARAAGITRYLAICDRLDHFPQVLEIANAAQDVWCSVGTHPHHAKDFEDTVPETLIDLAKHERVVAIGETGLDMHYGYSELDQQIASFKTHIKACQATGLPVIVHTREADRETADVLETAYAEQAFPILLHCYTGGQELADRALALGAYVSVSGILSFKNAKDVRAVIETVPADRIILETDCPYLTPMPYRGRRNEPAYLPYVADALATLQGSDRETVAAQCEHNALELFKKIPR